MSSVVETSQWRFLHSLRSAEMPVSVNMYIITLFVYLLFNESFYIRQHFL